MIRIHDNNSLFMNTYPGGKTFFRESDGTYSYRSFALGGCGGGKSTTENVAHELVKRYEKENVEAMLEKLGWRDVLVEFIRLKAEKRKQAVGDQHQKKIEHLKFLENFYYEHKDHDYSWWCNHIYERIASQPDFNENDVPTRHIHYAATQNVYLIKEYEALFPAVLQ